jgi:hypothetical protein
VTSPWHFTVLPQWHRRAGALPHLGISETFYRANAGFA